MDVKEAVNLAKQYVADLFSTEKIFNLGLEEVEYDDSEKVWFVTLGFSRPWDNPPSYATSVFTALGQQEAKMPIRCYKIVRISDASQKVHSVKNRET
jgi:hypothetical protein